VRTASVQNWTRYFKINFYLVKVKIKVSLYRPGVAQRVPGS